jgi:anti-anti-sigma factor
MSELESTLGGLLPAEGQPGHLAVAYDEGLTLVQLSGEIDLALGPELEEVSREAIERGVPVRVDVTAVSFIDSVGLGFIARLTAAGHQQGWRLVLVGASRRVNEGVNLTGLRSLMDSEG